MAATLGYGAKFYLHNGTALTELTGGLVSVNRPNLKIETVDKTHHGSAGGIREFMAGLADPGDLSVRLFYEPGSADDTLILSRLAAIAARTVASVAFKIVLKEADGTTQEITGNCIPTGWEADDVVVDDKMTAAFTGKVTGVTTQAASA
jgi:hypothetical protein